MAHRRQKDAFLGSEIVMRQRRGHAARLAIWLTVTSSEPVRPISWIVALTRASLRIGSIPTLGMMRPFLLSGWDYTSFY
jgi:hypothetical protein